MEACLSCLVCEATLAHSNPSQQADAIRLRHTASFTGGFEFDGVTEISPLLRHEVQHAAAQIMRQGIKSIVLSGVFSPINPAHEITAASIMKEHCGQRWYANSHASAFQHSYSLIVEKLASCC